MPLKEIILLSAVVVASIMASHPVHPLDGILAFELRILREVGRTDNWGSPSIFHQSGRSACLHPRIR